MKLSEKDLQNYGAQLLETDGWRTFRTEMTFQREYGRAVGEVGMPDMLYIRYNQTPAGMVWLETLDSARVQLLWCEWKRKGGKPSKAQLAWHEAERARGALTLIAGIDFEATPEGFFGWYKRSGLMRKAISPPKGGMLESSRTL